MRPSGIRPRACHPNLHGGRRSRTCSNCSTFALSVSKPLALIHQRNFCHGDLHSEAAIRAYGDEERLSKEMPGARRHCILPSIHRAASCSTQFALVASCRHDDSYVLTLPHDSRCMQMDKTLKAHSACWGCCSEVKLGSRLT